MVWWPFAPQPERADTSEVTDLHNGAPPLHSAVPSVVFRLRGSAALAGRRGRAQRAWQNPLTAP